MNLDDLKSVSKVVEALHSVRGARSQVPLLMSDVSEKDISGIPGLIDSGWACFLVMYPDGSGTRVDMRGCYVATEIVQAVDAVLEKKEAQLIEWLANMGVTV